MRQASPDGPRRNLLAATVTVKHRTSRRILVDQVGIRVDSGEVTCLVGESGSGKSLTVRALLGLIPRELDVAVSHLEQPGSSDDPPARLAFVPQRALSALNPLLRIGTQLVECAAIRSRGTRRHAVEIAEQLLTEVGIDSPGKRLRQYPHQLSGGQRQRVLMAMALIREPTVIVADEPTTALDSATQKQVLDFLRMRCESTGIGLLLVTHDLSVATMIADKLVVMYSGQIVEQGPAPAVLKAPLHPYTRALLTCTPEIGPDGRADLPKPIAGQMTPRYPDSKGCAFANRCTFAETRCMDGVVAVESQVAGREYRCLIR